jgi:hypothetical protein
MPKTLEQAKVAALVEYEVTGGKFCVIADPDCDGYYLPIPLAQHVPDIDPPTVYVTPKGKVF